MFHIYNFTKGTQFVQVGTYHNIEALDHYLKMQASQDIKKNVAVTYILTSPDSEQILGYYTLSSIGIFSGELPEILVKKLPRYPILPGVLLGRLAVDKN